MATVDPVDHAVNSLPPFMQRRMAKLSLAGAKFVQEAYGIYAWKVLIGGEMWHRYTHLAQAINDTWIEWLRAKSNRDSDTEVMLEQLEHQQMIERWD